MEICQITLVKHVTTQQQRKNPHSPYIYSPKRHIYLKLCFSTETKSFGAFHVQVKSPPKRTSLDCSIPMILTPLQSNQMRNSLTHTKAILVWEYRDSHSADEYFELLKGRAQPFRFAAERYHDKKVKMAVIDSGLILRMQTCLCILLGLTITETGLALLQWTRRWDMALTLLDEFVELHVGPRSILRKVLIL